MNRFDLTGKTAIVTGGGRGLGLGMSRALCEAGASVVMIGSSESASKAAQILKKEGWRAYGMKGDLGCREKLSELFEQAVQMLGGKLDILVNNAGVQRRNRSEDFLLEDWDRVLEINLTAVFRLCQLAGKKMLEQGRGKIINVASMLSFFGGYTVPAYAASKGGVAQLTRALSNEWAGRGIQVNAIAPGYMATEMNEALIQDSGRNAEILGRIPAGRWGTPEDVMGLIIFLASGASDYINGAIIPVDGGYLGK